MVENKEAVQFWPSFYFELLLLLRVLTLSENKVFERTKVPEETSIKAKIDKPDQESRPGNKEAEDSR